MPNSLNAKKAMIFHTRVVYNSKFKSVSRCEANINIRRNIQHIGINKRVKNSVIGKVAKVQEAPKQKCNIVQGVCCNVPVINQFDSLDIEDNLNVNTCDNVLDNVRINVPKQAHKVHSNERNGVGFTKNTSKQLQTEHEGECAKYVDTVDNCNVMNKSVMKNSDQCLEDKQISNSSTVQPSDYQFVNGFHITDTSGRTEPNPSREVPWEVVQQESSGFSEMVPVWDCKLAKQIKLQKAAAVPVLKNGKVKTNLLLASYHSVHWWGKKIGNIMAKYSPLLKPIIWLKVQDVTTINKQEF